MVGPRCPVFAAASSVRPSRGSRTRWWMMWPRKCGPSARQLRRDGSPWKIHAPLRVATSTAIRRVRLRGRRSADCLACRCRVELLPTVGSLPCRLRRFRNETATIGGSAADVIGLRRIRALDGWIALAAQRLRAVPCNCAGRADRVCAVRRPAIAPSPAAQPQADDGGRGHERGEHRNERVGRLHRPQRQSRRQAPQDRHDIQGPVRATSDEQQSEREDRGRVGREPGDLRAAATADRPRAPRTAAPRARRR